MLLVVSLQKVSVKLLYLTRSVSVALSLKRAFLCLLISRQKRGFITYHTWTYANEYHVSYVNVCKRSRMSTKLDVCEYHELCFLVRPKALKHKNKVGDQGCNRCIYVRGKIFLGAWWIVVEGKKWCSKCSNVSRGRSKKSDEINAGIKWI